MLNFVVKTVSVAVLKPRFAVIFLQEKVSENDAPRATHQCIGYIIATASKTCCFDREQYYTWD